MAARKKTQSCCCGKKDGVCEGDDVKAAGVGMRLPLGAEGTENYRRRLQILRQLGVRFDPAGSMGRRTKEKMMKSADIRVSKAHFPGNRTTPSKRFNKDRASSGARSLRHKDNAHGPKSTPIDTMMEDVDAEAEMPSQDGATRSSRRRLMSSGGTPAAGGGAAAAPRSGAAGGRTARAEGSALSDEMAAAATRELELMREIAALKRKHALSAADIERLEREARVQKAAIEDLEAKAATLQRKLHASDAKYKREIDALKQQLEDADIGAHRPLTAGMLHEKQFGQRIRQYTGFWSVECFDLFIDCLNADGLLDRVLVKQDMYQEEASSDGDETDGSEEGGDPPPRRHKKPHGNRALTPKDAIFFTLMWLRTGLDIKDLHALFGIGYSTACRYFAIYISFLRVWLEAEFPQPTADQIKRATPESFRKAFPSTNVQYIIDAHEQQCEEPTDLKCRRTVWSDYKHRTTNKFLGVCTPCGACVFASSNYGGKCDDKTLTLASGFMDLLLNGWTTLADKGFMMHAEFASAGHQLITPTHAVAGVPTYSYDESRWTNAIGKTRIHIERMFRRAQEWKILHGIIKINSMDLAGTIFKVCCLMGNFEPPLIRQGDDALLSLAELQWGV